MAEEVLAELDEQRWMHLSNSMSIRCKLFHCWVSVLRHLYSNSKLQTPQVLCVGSIGVLSEYAHTGTPCISFGIDHDLIRKWV